MKIFLRISQSATHINIDGILRPTTNSLGHPIHHTEQGRLNFWRWFGSSKTVDTQGRPIVFYHGTYSDFEKFRLSNIKRGNAFDRDSNIGIFLTPHPEQASYFALEKGQSKKKKVFADQEGSNILLVYAKMLNPLLVKFDSIEFKDPDLLIRLKHKAEDRDGIIIKNIHDTPTGKPTDLYIVFNPRQIKRALGNIGTFDSSPMILASDPNIATAFHEYQDVIPYQDEAHPIMWWDEIEPVNFYHPTRVDSKPVLDTEERKKRMKKKHTRKQTPAFIYPDGCLYPREPVPTHENSFSYFQDFYDAQPTFMDGKPFIEKPVQTQVQTVIIDTEDAKKRLKKKRLGKPNPTVDTHRLSEYVDQVVLEPNYGPNIDQDNEILYGITNKASMSNSCFEGQIFSLKSVQETNPKLPSVLQLGQHAKVNICGYLLVGNIVGIIFTADKVFYDIAIVIGASNICQTLKRIDSIFVQPC